MRALSIVRPAGGRIASGQKTIEVRRWRPQLAAGEDLLIVENRRYLFVEGDEDPDGRAVAIVRVGDVRPWTLADLEASCATSFEEGWLAWELYDVRPVTSSTPVLAARRLYELALPPDAQVGPPLSRAADEAFMRRAIALARPRVGRTAENPAVGCVLVKAGRVIAEAATAEGGRPHAEEQALAAAGEAARGATAFVTLEPCGERSNGSLSCAERLVRAGVIRVVFACDHGHDLSAGRGPARLRAAGLAVEAGLLREEAAALYAG